VLGIKSGIQKIQTDIIQVGHVSALKKFTITFWKLNSFTSLPSMSDRRTNRRLSRNEHTEKQRVDINLAGFQFAGSKAEQFLKELCSGKSLTFGRLKAIGLLYESICGVKFDRDFTRSRPLVCKWLTDHYNEICQLTEILKVETEALP
jgi:hypothetical protein